MAKEEQPAMPPPGFPVRSFNAPGHVEESFVERVDVTAPSYTKLARNVLYSAVTGAQQRIIDSYPALRLFRETINPFEYPWATRTWSTDTTKVNRSIGQESLIPPKYRKLVTHTETLSWENIEAAFPASLSGNQTLVEQVQETIYEARRRIVEEVINSGTSLSGQETDEQGTLSVVETIVADGTAVDIGYLVKTSSVTPLGNGKSIKIVVSYASFPILYDYDIDEETGQTILIQTQIVDATTATTATSSSGVVTKYRHIDKWRSLKIITTYSTPASYDEQRFGAQTFPALWDGWLFATDQCGQILRNFRSGFSANVKIRTTVTFTASKQTISGLTLIPKSLFLGKWGHIPEALMDASGITYSGNCVGTILYGASSPSYSAYNALIGTEQLVAGESVRTQKGSLYRNTSVYVTML